VRTSLRDKGKVTLIIVGRRTGSAKTSARVPLKSISSITTRQCAIRGARPCLAVAFVINVFVLSENNRLYYLKHFNIISISVCNQPSNYGLCGRHQSVALRVVVSYVSQMKFICLFYFVCICILIWFTTIRQIMSFLEVKHFLRGLFDGNVCNDDT